MRTQPWLSVWQTEQRSPHATFVSRGLHVDIYCPSVRVRRHEESYERHTWNIYGENPEDIERSLQNCLLLAAEALKGRHAI